MSPPPSETPPRLQFDAVQGLYHRGVEDRPCSLVLHPGQIHVLDDPNLLPDVCADMAAGLRDVPAGQVLVNGTLWSALDDQRAASVRRTWRRVFRADGWLSNLNLDENILLPLHTEEGEADEALRSEMVKISRTLDLQVPDGRPAVCSPEDRYRLQFIRALLGQPEVILVEAQRAYLDAGFLEKLETCLNAKIEEGSSLLWLGPECPVSPY